MGTNYWKNQRIFLVQISGNHDKMSTKLNANLCSCLHFTQFHAIHILSASNQFCHYNNRSKCTHLRKGRFCKLHFCFK